MESKIIAVGKNLNEVVEVVDVLKKNDFKLSCNIDNNYVCIDLENKIIDLNYNDIENKNSVSSITSIYNYYKNERYKYLNVIIDDIMYEYKEKIIRFYNNNYNVRIGDAYIGLNSIYDIVELIESL